MIKKPYKGNENYIFISYSHKNTNEVYDLISNLQDNGYNVWYDEGIDPGTEWDENIADHIRGCTYFIAYITMDYVQSQNCKDELNYARDLNRDRLLIYGANVDLPEGMKMRLSRLQAIFKYKYKDERDFYSRLFEAQGIEKCKTGSVDETNILPTKTNQVPEKNSFNKKAVFIIAAAILAIIVVVAAIVVFNKPSESSPSVTVSSNSNEELAVNQKGDTVSLESIEVESQRGSIIEVEYVIINNTDEILKEVHLEGEAYDKDGNISTKICPGGQNTIKPGKEFTIRFVWDVVNENSGYYAADTETMKITGYSYETDEGYFRYAFESEIGPISIWEPKKYTYN